MNGMSPDLLAPYILRANGAAGLVPDRPDTVAGAAQEFEAQFIYQLLKQMRESMATSLGGDDTEGGFGFEILGSTLDIELARVLSDNGGIGLARMMIEAATRNAPESVPASGSATPESATEARRHGDGLVADVLRASVPPWRPDQVGSQSVSELFGGNVTSNYGWRTDPFTAAAKFHHGIDIAMAYGVEVPAADEGRVIEAGEQGRYGNTVVIEHPSGTRTRYAHLSELGVQVGQTVMAGQTIGRAGSSGAATGPHLHFEVIVDNQRMDPLSIEARASLEEQP